MNPPTPDDVARALSTPAPALIAPELVDAFHDHLDRCEQCREHPFDLCPRGAELLLAAGRSAAAAAKQETP